MNSDTPAITKAMRARGAALVVVGAAALSLTACGAEAGATKAAASDQAGKSKAPVESGTPSQSPTSSANSSDAPNPAESARVEEAREAAARERAEAAPSGNPAPTKVEVPEPDEYGFGEVAATGEKGEVVVYQPVPGKDGLSVPVTITNSGGKRTFYEVRIKVTGPDGFEDTVRLSTDTTGVYPGTTWPQKVMSRDRGHPTPSDPEVSIVSVSREGLSG